MKNSFPSASKMLENPIFCFLETYRTYIGFEVCNVIGHPIGISGEIRGQKNLLDTL